MGCCHSEQQINRPQFLLSEKLKTAIDSGSLKRISMILEIMEKSSKSSDIENINKEFTTIRNFNLNPLGYCLYIGDAKIFKFLNEKGASIKYMEQLLESQNMRAINYICYRGFLELLVYYLPIYLQDTCTTQITEKSYTIDLRDSLPKYTNFDLPIHSACRARKINIVYYLYYFFKNKPTCPKEFDILSVDEYYGEDAGLIACRVGDFSMIKMLHESCKLTFKNLNKYKENAIMICVCANKKFPSYSYLECISYLVEIVKVDIAYMHEELLLVAEGEEIISYLELQLEKVNIFTKKSDTEKYPTPLKIVVEEFGQPKDPLFTTEVRELLEGKENSIISSISDERSKNNENSLIDFIVEV